MKRLILDVSCVDENLDEVPNTLLVELDDATINEIKRLSEIVKQNNVYSINKFFYEGLWSEVYDEGTEDLEAFTKAMEENTCRIDSPMLTVTDNSFYFEAVPKHCDNGAALLSRSVKLSDLDNKDTYISEC